MNTIRECPHGVPTDTCPTCAPAVNAAHTPTPEQIEALEFELRTMGVKIPARDTAFFHAAVRKWLAAWNDTGALVAENEALKNRVSELEPAAECWIALAKCYRITCMGYAGLPPGQPHANGYAHATFNLWTVKGDPPKGASGDAQDLQGRNILGDFMKVAIANSKVQP